MHKYKKNYPWVCLSIICLCIYLFCSVQTNMIDYNRELILDGQYWRLISGNFNHTNEYHLILNIVALMVISGLHASHYSLSAFSLLILYLASLVGLGIFIFSPSVGLYVGLSGILHGLIVFGGALDVKSQQKTGWLLIIGAIIKVIYEQAFDNTAQMNKLIDAQVLTDAHLYGLIAGLIAIPGVLYILELNYSCKDDIEK